MFMSPIAISDLYYSTMHPHAPTLLVHSKEQGIRVRHLAVALAPPPRWQHFEPAPQGQKQPPSQLASQSARSIGSLQPASAAYTVHPPLRQRATVRRLNHARNERIRGASSAYPVHTCAYKQCPSSLGAWEGEGRRDRGRVCSIHNYRRLYNTDLIDGLID